MTNEQEKEGMIRSGLLTAVIALTMLCVYGHELGEKKYREKGGEDKDPSKTTQTTNVKKPTFEDLDIRLVNSPASNIQEASQNKKSVKVAEPKEVVQPQPVQPEKTYG